jgi:ribose transport system ATP-binding protein
LARNDSTTAPVPPVHPQQTVDGRDAGPAGPPPFELRCQGISKRFPGVVALRRLDFAARSGEVHAILGENGAGKSTFIKILGGAVRPDAGTIELAGEPVAAATPRGARELGIGLVYQELSLIPHLTVAQNVLAAVTRPSRIGVFSAAALRKRLRLLWEHYEAPPVNPDAKVRHLGFATRQVVEIMRALASEPRVVVFDEATAGLPAREATWALGLARRLAGEGKLVLFISHRLPEIRRVADRVTILRDGDAVLADRVDALDDARIVEAMLGRKPQRLLPGPIAPPRDRVVLSVRALSVGHRLRDVSFELREGEILGVGGLQGQGQSTLLLALFGILRARGEVEVDGRRVHVRSPHRALHSGIGLALVPEDRRNEGLMVRKSVRENVALPNLPQLTRWGFVSASAEERLAWRAVEKLHVKIGDVESPVSALSGGNQQKIVVGKLLELGARILLFHDPTRGIDVGTKAEIFQLARELTADGHSILFYSSDNQELAGMCDRVMVLRGGEVATILDGPVSEDAILRAAIAVPEGP